MIVSITTNFEDGKERYDWEVYDGPDGIEYKNGVEDSLGACFERIVAFRTLMMLDYL